MMKKTIDVVELSNIYSIEEGLWWMDRDKFPNKIDYRTFQTVESDWNKMVDEKFEVINTYHRIRSNDTRLKIKTMCCTLKNDPNVIVSWKINHDIGKGRIEISQMTVLWSHYYSPKFDVTEFDSIFQDLKLEEERKSKVYMVVQRHHGLDLQDFDIDIPEMDITMNYGSEWASKHELLLEHLMSTKKKGIALLHGLPGTGKSMYIRHLISALSESKTVVYLPNQLINNITDPGFIPLMAEYSGSILVIEDADEAIKSRKTGGGIVDKLLNLADGILSDFLGMKIICTFNNDLSTIDDALLRKGRLILKHQFGKLEVDAAQKLSDKLGFGTIIEDPMTLAEIYNQEDKLNDTKSKQERKIGFK